MGYAVQMFYLNSIYMDVPQARERVFFIANRCGFGKLNLDFNYDPILFNRVRTKTGVADAGETMTALLNKAKAGDAYFEDVYFRLTGKRGMYFTSPIVADESVCPTITSGGTYGRLCDKLFFSDDDFRNVSSFPQDYNFCDNKPQYVCGMSVPPNMMANIAQEVYEQWLK
jgi:DNA (cytosine-5)-methyltransferase 1